MISAESMDRVPGSPPGIAAGKEKKYMPQHVLKNDFQADADSPPVFRRTGGGRFLLESSQPGTRAPSQSGFRHHIILI